MLLLLLLLLLVLLLFLALVIVILIVSTSAILTARPRHGERAVLAPYPLAFGLQTTSDADYCATDHASFSCEGGVYSLRHCRDRRLFLRKASARSDAGSTAGTARSSKSLVERDKEKF